VAGGQQHCSFSTAPLAPVTNDNNMVLHVQNISQQGIFNENLRRSFEKLTADKSDIKKEKVNNIIFKKSNLQGILQIG